MENGHKANPINRAVRGWWLSVKVRADCALHWTWSFHTTSKVDPVRREPHTMVCNIFNAAVHPVMVKIYAIHNDKKQLWSGHRKDCTTPLGKGTVPSAVRLTYSRNDATARRTNSGNDQTVPGGAVSGSCLRHQACSRRVLASLRKYACRDSEAAAHKSGMAANPRGCCCGDGTSVGAEGSPSPLAWADEFTVVSPPP